MKLLSIQIFSIDQPNKPPAIPVAQASDLSSFGFLQRSSVGEFLNFLSKTVAERTASGQRQSVQENNHTAHSYFKPIDNLVGVIVTDSEYPTRVAFSLLNKLLEEFTQKIPKAKWKAAVDGSAGGTRPINLGFGTIDEYLVKYQDPKQADTILKVQQELDETKIVLHKTIESVLERGEKLDNLVERSNALSSQSKMFYKTAKKQNSCCVIA
ncbi:Longin-like domain-containing protein [Phakopsora pachyrhizi]|uniref:Synaptobrevin homolog YKT6 n=1 Tax=Phakopsora pachyrhizi TaxID=170000 RepID=A0AAV0BNM4_PHAPC|nr:Longin-like domain-containing protein [Phakopsora pachyrhizi]CAH7688867.1 Longin-like domain-containing protein [Phakopsora pachyrhizi]